MATPTSPRAADPKMVESQFIMAHASSSYACAKDGYLKHSHTTHIDGENRLGCGWFLVGFGIVGGHMTQD
jgi:hypothetical protein